MERRQQQKQSDNVSTVKIRVLYADTDRMGVVYHGTYFRWFEAARASYMRGRGKRYSDVEKSGYFLPVVEAHAEYMKPAVYDEVLDVSAWISELGRATLEFSYVISRDGVHLVRGYTRHAAVNAEGRPRRLPDELAKLLMGPETGPQERMIL